MNKFGRIALIAGALVVFSAGLGWVIGSVSPSGSYVSSELYRDLLEFEGTRVDIPRTKIYVPADYGHLITITGRGDGATLWYMQGDTIRNVVVGDGPVIVERGGKIRP